MNDPDRLGDWFGRFITLYRSAGHAMPADESRSRIEIEWDLQQGHVLHRHPWTRMAWRRAGKGARLYAGGEHPALPVRAARPLSAAPRFDRKGVVWGQSVAVRVAIGGHRNNKQK